MAALVERQLGDAGVRSSGSGASNGFTNGGGGGMGDLPGMLPAAAERAKADGNLHLFSKKVGRACLRLFYCTSVWSCARASSSSLLAVGGPWLCTARGQ